MIARFAFVVVLSMPFAVVAAELRVQTLDFEWQSGSAVGADDSVFMLNTADGERRFRWSELLAIKGVMPAGGRSTNNTEGGTIFAYPLSGGVVSGKLRPSRNGMLSIDIGNRITTDASLTSLAALRFMPLDQLSASLRDAFDVRRRDRKPGRDLLLLLRGNDIRPVPGTLVALDEDGWSFAFGGKNRKGSYQSAVGVILGSPAMSIDVTTPSFRLSNGDEWQGRIVDGDREHLRIENPAFGTISLPWSQLLGAELASSRLVHLETLKPIASVSRTVIGMNWSPKVNRNVVNGPLMVGRRPYDRGIGVHATHTLEYQLGKAYARFAADFGIDDSVAPHGSCIFRIRADEEIVFESEIVRGGMSPQRVTLDVSQVDRIKLEVDSADELDISDRANWCNPVLIRALK